ncbi:MAG: hypothetical protein Q7J80_08460 [Anaerolineales bacterium]|nr:hypothetical protein [Anaerolineales bacterium]HLA86573.1 hypothetical protein [Anaerolineales bacterium]
MATPRILQDFSSLSPQAQKQLLDYLDYLKARYPAVVTKRVKKIKLKDEPFIGMWQSRSDIRNGAEYVRDLRRREWGRKA